MIRMLNISLIIFILIDKASFLNQLTYGKELFEGTLVNYFVKIVKIVPKLLPVSVYI